MTRRFFLSLLGALVAAPKVLFGRESVNASVVNAPASGYHADLVIWDDPVSPPLSGQQRAVLRQMAIYERTFLDHAPEMVEKYLRAKGAVR